MKLLLFLSLSFISHLSIGQPSDAFASTDSEWNEGSILLKNGKELKGLLKYSHKSDLLSYENGSTSKSFTARQVTGFEFFDDVDQKQRVFYSAPYEDAKRDVQRQLFFELLMDFEGFAVLSKVAPVKLDKREYSTPAMFNPIAGSFSAGKYYGYPSTISQTETIFLMSTDGLITPYLEITEKDIDGTFFDRFKKRNKILNEEALKDYTENHYKQLLAFAKRNDLSLKVKGDLLKIFEYYGELAKNNPISRN
jgi:hypothetical protein